MTTIAEALGINWTTENPSPYRLTLHAQQQAAAKGWTVEDVLLAAAKPLHTYRSGRVAGQVRHVRNGIVAVIDPATAKVVTVYVDRVETALRVDQRDSDALHWDARH
jgi:hypothetical protein